jgi:hypothetical protein
MACLVTRFAAVLHNDLPDTTTVQAVVWPQMGRVIYRWNQGSDASSLVSSSHYVLNILHDAF